MSIWAHDFCLSSIEVQLLIVTTVFKQLVGSKIMDSVTDCAAVRVKRSTRMIMIMAKLSGWTAIWTDKSAQMSCTGTQVAIAL